MKAHTEYLKYVLRHKWFVFKACLRLGVPLRLAIVHDLSKFSPQEWGAYVHTFFNSDGTKKDLRKQASYDPNNTGEVTEFSFAWMHHQRNKHHWQAWISIGDSGNLKAVPMPEVYIREMIADWVGAGSAITGNSDPSEWYEKNKGKMILHSETRLFAESLIRGLTKRAVDDG
jgi:hypothetical protein